MEVNYICNKSSDDDVTEHNTTLYDTGQVLIDDQSSSQKLEETTSVLNITPPKWQIKKRLIYQNVL